MMAEVCLVQGLHAFFTGEDDTWEAWLVFDTGPKLGSNTIKIRRGFSSSGAANPSQVCFNAIYVYPKLGSEPHIF
jgi:hypothetical protein